MENTEFTSCGQRCRIVTQELIDSGELASRPTLPEFVRRQFAFGRGARRLLLRADEAAPGAPSLFADDAAVLPPR